MSNTYTSDNIEYLSGLEHIRVRSGMYIGEAINPRHLFVEALDNSIDELQTSNATKINIIVNRVNNTYTITDDGRGIPIGPKVDPSDKSKTITTLELVTRYPNAGGKFSNDAYKIRGGLHGVGSSIIVALSNVSEFTTKREGKCNIVRYTTENTPTNLNLENITKSEKVTKELGLEVWEFDNEPTEIRGTTVEFSPNPECFISPVIPIDFIISKCKICNAHFENAIELVVIEEDGESVAVDVSSEFTDLVYRPMEDASKYFDDYIEVSIDTGESLRLYFEYNSDIRYSIESYCNLIKTPDGGTHYIALRNAIETAWKPYLSSLETRMHNDDCRVGLYGALSVFISDPDFSSQTKEKLISKSESITLLFNKLSEEITSWIESDEDRKLALLKRFELYRQERDRMSSHKDIMKLIKLADSTTDGRVKRKSVVRGLIECTSTSREDTELILVEGNSAAGPAAMERDKVKQAVLPLRGKVKNVTGMAINNALKTKEIQDIVNSIGCGVGDNLDLSRCRYERILLNADSDPDGHHIAALLVSVMVNLLPDIVKAGMVYLIKAPLYAYYRGSDRIFVDSLSEIPNDLVKSHSFQRFKGLGEMDNDEYEESCLDRHKRRLVQVTFPEDLERFNEIMGSSSGRRSVLVDLGLLQDITDHI